jgi:hypothetical protein
MSAEINTEHLLMLVQELKGKEEKRTNWFITPLITVIIAAAGVFISWGMMMKTTEYLQNQVETLQTRVYADNLEITKLQMAQVKNDTVLQVIKEDVTEVKNNVNKLVRRRGF